MNHKQSEEKIPLLRIENLKKYYPIKGGIITHTTGYVKAVDGVSFQICQGETLGLVGESGCGKSTIGRQLVGLEKPTDGTVYYKDHDLGRMNRKDVKPFRTKLQMVFQDPYSSLNPRKHIYEILAQPMLYHGISTKAGVEKDILNLLDMVGLPRSVLGRYPHEFSGGQRQRIGIAKALSLNPEFIVCDEPVSALDVSIQAQIINLLLDLKEHQNLTYMFITHDLSVVKYISDRVGVMYLGNMVELAEADEIFHHPIHPYTEALLNAIPTTDTVGAKELSILEGDIPSPVNPPKGCKFHTRCKYCTEICTQVVPAWEEVRPNHFVACHHKLEVKE